MAMQWLIRGTEILHALFSTEVFLCKTVICLICPTTFRRANINFRTDGQQLYHQFLSVIYQFTEIITKKR